MKKCSWNQGSIVFCSFFINKLISLDHLGDKVEHE